MYFILEFEHYKVWSLGYSHRVHLMDYCLPSAERVVTEQ